MKHYNKKTPEKSATLQIEFAPVNKITTFVTNYSLFKFIDMKTKELTYDVHFNDSTDSNGKGFQADFDYCKNYIEQNNGTNNSYFEDYKGGTVSIVCNETGETVYEETVR